MTTKTELRKQINDGIVALSEMLLELEGVGGDEALLSEIDKRKAEYVKQGIPEHEALEKAGIDCLTPLEIARRRAERGQI